MIAYDTIEQQNTETGISTFYDVYDFPGRPNIIRFHSCQHGLIKLREVRETTFSEFAPTLNMRERALSHI